MTKRREAWLTDASFFMQGGNMKYIAIGALLIACGDKSEDSAEPEEVIEESE